MRRVFAAAVLTALALSLISPASATVIFVLSESPGSAFAGLSVFEDFEGISPKDTSLASIASAGITYAPVPGNVFVSASGYTNCGVPGATTSGILTANGNEHFAITPSFTVRSIGFDIYTINEPGNPSSVGGADPVVGSVMTVGPPVILNLPASVGNFGFLGIVSDDPIVSVTWEADLGGVRNTGIDNGRVADYAVTEPGTPLLIASGLTGLPLRHLRRS